MYRYVKKRQNGRQNSQKALRVPFPLQWDQILQGGYGSFQVIWRTDLEGDLQQTQNYCLGLLALYLHQMIIQIQYSMMLLACCGGAETMPSHSPMGKALTCLNSIPAFEKSFPEVFVT